MVAHVATTVSVYERLPEFTARRNEFLFRTTLGFAEGIELVTKTIDLNSLYRVALHGDHFAFRLEFDRKRFLLTLERFYFACIYARLRGGLNQSIFLKLCWELRDMKNKINTGRILNF